MSGFVALTTAQLSSFLARRIPVSVAAASTITSSQFTSFARQLASPGDNKLKRLPLANGGHAARIGSCVVHSDAASVDTRDSIIRPIARPCQRVGHAVLQALDIASIENGVKSK